MNAPVQRTVFPVHRVTDIEQTGTGFKLNTDAKPGVNGRPDISSADFS